MLKEAERNVRSSVAKAEKVDAAQNVQLNLREASEVEFEIAVIYIKGKLIISH